MTPTKTGSAQSPQAIYEKALKLLFQHKYDQAEKALRGLVDQFPEESALQARVRTFLKLCEKRQASAKSQPDSLDPYDVGVLEHNRGNFAEAVTNFKLALKKTKTPQDHVHYALAASEARQGHGDKALRHLEQAIEARSKNRFFAQNDPDFRSLQKDESFRKLIRPSGKR